MIETSEISIPDTTIVSVARDGEEIGEWSLEEIRVLYQKGQLFSSDHYWHAGMEQWGMLRLLLSPPHRSVQPGEFKDGDRVHAGAEPLTMLEEAAAKLGPLPEGWKLAGFYARAGARSIDYLMLTTVVVTVFSLLSYLVSSAAFPPPLGVCLLIILWYVVSNLIFFVWDWLWLTLTGTSPGKWIYKLRVLPANHQPFQSSTAAERSHALLQSLWYLFLFPLATASRAVAAEKEFTQTGTTNWDRTARTAVISGRIGYARLAAAVVLSFLSLLGILLWCCVAFADRQSIH